MKTAWTEDETRKRLRTKAEELVEKAKGGTALEQAGRRDRRQTGNHAAAEARGDPEDPAAHGRLACFHPADQGVGNRSDRRRQGQALFQVAEIKAAPALDDKQAETLREEMRRGMGVDILTQYVAGLQRDYGVSINNKAVSDAARTAIVHPHLRPTREGLPARAFLKALTHAALSRIRCIRPKPISNGEAASRLDAPRRRSGDAGFGDAEAWRRPADELPAGIRRGRRGARPLFRDRLRSGHHLARPWR